MNLFFNWAAPAIYPHPVVPSRCPRFIAAAESIRKTAFRRPARCAGSHQIQNRTGTPHLLQRHYAPFGWRTPASIRAHKKCHWMKPAIPFALGRRQNCARPKPGLGAKYPFGLGACTRYKCHPICRKGVADPCRQNKKRLEQTHTNVSWCVICPALVKYCAKVQYAGCTPVYVAGLMAFNSSLISAFTAKPSINWCMACWSIF